MNNQPNLRYCIATTPKANGQMNDDQYFVFSTINVKKSVISLYGLPCDIFLLDF